MEGHARTADIRLAKYYPGEDRRRDWSLQWFGGRLEAHQIWIHDVHVLRAVTVTLVSFFSIN
jgi:hypothetical protein